MSGRWYRDVYRDAVWENETLKAQDKAVAETYARHARDEEGNKSATASLAWLTYERLMAKSGIGRRAGVSASVARLVESGWLKPVQQVSRRATVYRLTIPVGGSSDGGTTEPDDRGSDGGTTVVPFSESGSSTLPSGSSDGGTQPLGPLKDQTTISLSEASARPTASSPVPFEGRERDEQVSEDRNTQPLTAEQKLIAKRGVTGDKIDYVLGWIESGNQINGLGWWITADRNGTLDAHITDALKAEATDQQQPARICIRCDGHGQDWNGDYFTTNPCLACHGSGTALESGDRRCPEHKHNPIACGLCRADRRTSPSYIEQVNQQRRSAERGEFKRSVGAMRAEQGLRVAAELDRQYPPRRPNQHVPYLDREDTSAYKTSTLYPREIRSPADQRVADGAILHARYKAIEEGTA